MTEVPSRPRDSPYEKPGSCCGRNGQHRVKGLRCWGHLDYAIMSAAAVREGEPRILEGTALRTGIQGEKKNLRLRKYSVYSIVGICRKAAKQALSNLYVPRHSFPLRSHRIHTSRQT